jgi:uncharacterized membrane protein YfcA
MGGWAYLHPALAGLTLVALAVALGMGFRLRDLRLRRRQRPEGGLRHQRWSRPAVTLVLVSFIAGLVTMGLARGSVLTTLHGWVAMIALVGFAASTLVGQAIASEKSERRALHGLLATLALLAALATALTGMELLP